MYKMREESSEAGTSIHNVDSLRSEMMENIFSLEEQYEHLQKSLITQRTKKSLILAKGVPKSRINLNSLTEHKKSRSSSKLRKSFQIIPMGHSLTYLPPKKKSTNSINVGKGISIITNQKIRRTGIKVISSYY